MNCDVKKVAESDKQITRNSFLWNLVALVLNASQSFLFLLIINRGLGIKEAGYFSFAFAIANQYLAIGKFGMRNFQVTDTKQKYTFLSYFQSRLITTGCMFIVTVVYCVYLLVLGRYQLTEIIFLFLLCFWKMIDSMDDIFQGLYQQKGRLDVGSFWLSVRTGVTMFVFCIGIFMQRQLLLPIVFAVLASILLFGLFLAKTFPLYGENIHFVRNKGVWYLLIETLPLFISTFFSFYLSNCAKYAISSQTSDYMQAIYGFISMPILFISLLNCFFFQPVLKDMASSYDGGLLYEFKKIVSRQMIILAILSFLVLVGGYFIGIPILSMLYKTDLSLYKMEFVLLLLSGCFSFLSGGLLYNILLLMRENVSILITYAGLSILAKVISNYLVRSYGLMGAAILQVGIMVLMSIILVALVLIKLNRSSSNV